MLEESLKPPQQKHVQMSSTKKCVFLLSNKMMRGGCVMMRAGAKFHGQKIVVHFSRLVLLCNTKKNTSLQLIYICAHYTQTNTHKKHQLNLISTFYLHWVCRPLSFPNWQSFPIPLSAKEPATLLVYALVNCCNIHGTSPPSIRPLLACDLIVAIGRLCKNKNMFMFMDNHNQQ